MNIYHIVSIICLGMCIIMFFYFKWYIKKHVGSIKMLDDAKTEVNRIIAEMTRITDRDVQLVEDRIVKLNALKEETDKRIAIYVKELEKSRSGETLYTSLGRGIRDALTQNHEDDLPAPETSLQTFPQDTIVLSAQAGLPRANNEPPKPIPLTETPEYLMQEIRTSIDQFLNEGLSAGEIASRLGISIAEVNLAINLRRR